MSPPDDLIDRRPLGPDLFASVSERCITDATGAERPVWVFGSEGLERVGQRELVLAVLREEDQDRTRYPQFPLWLFDVAHRHAQNGSTVGPGGRTILGTPGSDVDPRLAGFVYDDHPKVLRHLPPGGDRAPLAAVPLLSGEIQAAEHVGQARVLALLGQQARAFPYPWWFKPGREAVIDDRGDVEASILDRVPSMAAHYLEVGLRGVQLEIVLPAEECGALHDALVNGRDVAALLPRIPHTADRHFVWRRGQDGPSSIWDVRERDAPPTTSGLELTGGSFLLLAHGDVEAEASALEDGFGVVLPNTLWGQLLAAVERREPFHLPVQGKLVTELALRLTSRSHVSPFGEWHADEGEFHLYRPQPVGPDTRRLHNVHLERLVMLMSTAELFAAIDEIAELSLLVDDACAIVDDALEGAGSAWGELVANLRVVPADGVHAQVAVRDADVAEKPLQALVNRLDSLPSLPGLRREVHFELWMRPAE
jgi:hypothetical protein